MSPEEKAKKARKLINFSKSPDLASFDESQEVNDNLDRIATATEGTQKIELMGAEIITIKGKKGDKGDKPNNEDLVSLIEPLIPEPLAGPQGSPGADSSVPGPKGNDGYSPLKGVDYFDGGDGKSGSPGANGTNGKDGSPDTPKEIVVKLESLKKEARLDKSAIKGLDKLRDEIALHSVDQARRLYAGFSGVQTIRAGSGVTVTKDPSDNYTINTVGGSGDVVGPASATDTALALFDGTTGKLLKDSAVTLSSTVLAPNISDGIALGSATKMFADLFLASGGVINFNNGNVTLTHSAGILTLGGTATLALGTNSITMTGSLGATGARLTKVWTAALESTAMPTVGGVVMLTSLTAPQFTTIELGAATDTTISRNAAGQLNIEGVQVVTISNTVTLTNKRINPRIGTEASSATSTPTADTVDQWNVTALAAADAFAAPTGTPVNGQGLIIRIKDNGTARALTWNAIYRASSDLALPTTTIISKTLYLGFKYNTADSKWDLLALLNNF